MHNLYKIPVIQQDLREQDTIIHIANSLEYLSNVVNDIFNRIDKRIEENKKRTDEIGNRVEVANAKISKLIGTNKATKVYSCTKYPASNIHQDAKTIFVKLPVIFKLEKHVSTSTTSIKHDEKKLQDKLQFYHVKAGEKIKREIFDFAPEEGLGNIPNDLNSVTSLLLYNTQENPYKRYVLLDPLNPTNRVSHLNKPSAEPIGIDAAPLSITNRTSVARNYTDKYFYSPGLGEVPQIDVPLDLPDLPGIADDINYSLEPGPAIAPSVATTPAVIDLPIICELPTTQDMGTKMSLLQQQFSLATNLPDVMEKRKEKVLVEQEQPDTTAIVPPQQSSPPGISITSSEMLAPKPPAMPPPPPKLPEVTCFPVALIAVPDVRANLMEAIRQAGGAGRAKLKIPSIKKEKDNAVFGGGNLMADLHAKLSMRRKGISGVKPVPETSGGVMDKISAMIPAPPKPKPIVENAEDSDWE